MGKEIDKIDFDTIHDLKSVIEYASQNYDGHLTIFRFTTGWKVVFNTPTIDFDERNELNNLPHFMDINSALSYIKENKKKKECDILSHFNV